MSQQNSISWLQFGVEDTVDVKQMVTKGQKDVDNNKKQ